MAWVWWALLYFTREPPLPLLSLRWGGQLCPQPSGSTCTLVLCRLKPETTNFLNWEWESSDLVHNSQKWLSEVLLLLCSARKTEPETPTLACIFTQTLVFSFAWPKSVAVISGFTGVLLKHPAPPAQRDTAVLKALFCPWGQGATAERCLVSATFCPSARIRLRSWKIEDKFSSTHLVQTHPGSQAEFAPSHALLVLLCRLGHGSPSPLTPLGSMFGGLWAAPYGSPLARGVLMAWSGCKTRALLRSLMLHSAASRKFRSNSLNKL